jgi:hypothetical protein
MEYMINVDIKCICRVIGTEGEPRMSAVCAFVAFSCLMFNNLSKNFMLNTLWVQIMVVA